MDKIDQTFELISPEILNNCMQAMVHAFDSNENVAVRIFDKEATRSAAQHSLKWRWMGYLATVRQGNEGRDKDGWNAWFKARFIRHLLVAQDEKWVDEFAQYDKTMKLLKQYEGDTVFDDTAKKYAFMFWSDHIETKALTAKNMTEFMNLVDRYCVVELGVQLPVKDDLRWAIQ